MEEYLSKEKKEKIMKCTTFDEMLDIQFGPANSPEREQLERETEAFILAERLKEKRKRVFFCKNTLRMKRKPHRRYE